MFSMSWQCFSVISKIYIFQGIVLKLKICVIPNPNLS